LREGSNELFRDRYNRLFAFARARDVPTNELFLGVRMSENETATSVGRESRGRVLLVMCGTSASEHELPGEGVVVIGRGRDAGVVVDHPTLSRAHAKLTLGSHVTIVDCGSRNGTIVAGRALKEGEVVLVAPGSPIELGDALLVIRTGHDPARDLLASSGASREGLESIDRTVQRIARSNVAVLLVGEPGAGKAFLAARVHASSGRAAARLVTLAGGPATTADEIATAVRDARGGTLVVREPSLLSRSGQAALLASLAGASGLVRTVTLTQRDLFAAAGARELDSALFHRLAGVSVVVPPLRARVGELGALADALLVELTTEHERPRMLLSTDAMSVLARHTWPGNLRELRNALSKAVLLGKGRVLTGAHLDLGGGEHAAGASGGSLSAVVDEAEHRRILDALRHCNGNQTRAAKTLGISRGTLISRLERFGVPRPRK
jgi:two-component system response regulator AtoC